MGMHGLSRVTSFEDGSDVQTFEMKGYSFPSTVFAAPGSGYSITVSYSVDGGVNYTSWSAGSVSSFTESVFDAPISHLKFTRAQTSSPATGNESRAGVC